MSLLMLKAVKWDEEESARNIQRSEEGIGEENTTHLNQIAHQILKQNHQIMTVILIHIHLHHLMLLLQVMTGVEGERNPPRGTSIGVANVKGIDDVIRDVGGVIGDQNASQNGCYIAFIFLFLLFPITC